MRPSPADDHSTPPTPVEFHRRILELDAALATGINLPPATPPPARSDDPHDSNLTRARECLELLYRHRPTPPLSEPPSDASADPADASPPPQLPTTPTDSANLPRLGRFEVICELGHGGHGVVFLARDPVLRRQVALKVPRPEALLTPKMRERFLREGQAAALLNHPHVLTVYEAGELGPMCFLAQAYCPGQTLAQWLNAQTMPVPAKLAARIVLALAEGVEHAHSRGILHRDLKPSNVLLEPCEPSTASTSVFSPRADDPPCPFVPKLTDFGLAKLLESETKLSLDGAVIGTPGYMPPEQAAGDIEHVGPPVDVYGLGAVLYELLCRRPPFQGDTQLEILQAVLHQEPAPPRRVRADVPRDLEAICLRALDKTPQRRYASARHLADELERFLRGQPTHTRPLSLTERVTRWARRRPTLAALLLVIIGATLAIVTLLSWSNARLSRSLLIADRERYRAVQAEQIAQEKTLESQQHAYQADMRVAGAAWERGQPEQALDLLVRHLPGRDVRDFRGFLWNYLWRQMQLGSTVLTTHAGGATAVALAPDRACILTGGADGVIRAFTADGQLQYELPPLDGSTVNQLAISPDGAWAAAALNSGTIHIWSVATGIRLPAEHRHADWAAAVAFSPDSSLLASGGGDRLVRLWSLPTGEPRGELTAHADTVRALAFTHDPQTLFSSSEDRTIRAWDLARHAPHASLPEGLLENPTESWARTLALEGDGSALVGGFWNHHLVYWDLRKGHFGHQIRVVDEDANPLCTAGGAELAVGRADGAIRLVRFGSKFGSGSPLLRRHSDRIDALAFDREGSLLASASRDGTVRLWNLDQPLRKAEFWHPAPIRPAMCWRGPFAALISARDTIDLYEMPSGRRLATVQSAPALPNPPPATHPPPPEPPSDPPVFLAQDLDPHAGILLVADSTPQLRAFDVRTSTVTFCKPLPELPRRLAVGPDGTSVAVLGEQQLLLFALPSATPQATIALPFPARALAWLADGQHCALGCLDGQIRIWDTRRSRQVTAFKAHNESIHQLCTSNDGSLLVSCSDDQRVLVWRTADGSRWATVAPGTIALEAGFLYRNARLLLRDRDNRLRFFALPSGEELFEFDLASHCTGICTSPEGHLALAAEGYRIRLLDGRPVDLPPNAGTRLNPRALPTATSPLP